MDIPLLMAILINVGLLGLQGWSFLGIKRKRDLFKYYTYLQNLLSLLVSVFFVLFATLHLLGVETPLPFLEGLRYVTVTGLLVTMLIYTFLSLVCKDEKNQIGVSDCKEGFSPKWVNAFLHYVCPLLSFLSFAVFERKIPIHGSFWTLLVAVPSVLYWIVYFLLTVTKRWVEPYRFHTSENKTKNNLLEVGFVVLFVVLFLATSFVAWNVR